MCENELFAKIDSYGLPTKHTYASIFRARVPDFSGIPPYRSMCHRMEKSSRDFQMSALQRNGVDLLSRARARAPRKKIPTISRDRAGFHSNLNSLNLFRLTLHLASRFTKLFLFLFSPLFSCLFAVSARTREKISIRSARAIVFANHVPIERNQNPRTIIDH